MLLSGIEFRLDIAIDLEVDHESMNKIARHEKVHCKRDRCIHNHFNQDGPAISTGA